MVVNYLFYIVGQFTGQWTFVIKKMYKRGKVFFRLMILSLKRAYLLYKPLEFMLFSIWLFLSIGWKHYSVNYFRYYRSITQYVLRTAVLLGVFAYAYYHIDFASYCNSVFDLFQNPILGSKGYLPYAIVVSCTAVWFILLACVLYSRAFRYLLKPYAKNILLLNLVVFILLMSLFTKVGRAKFGIRVWYPTDRAYGGRLGFEFWD
jgi:hypothetical protein